MAFINKVLSKSDGDDNYKDEYEKLEKENQQLSKQLDKQSKAIKKHKKQIKQLKKGIKDRNKDIIKLRSLLPKDEGRNWIYEKKFNKELNLSNPQDFNEKINWLIVNYYGPREAELADKKLVKEILMEKNIEDLNIPKTYKVYNDADEIDLDELPEQFVLKCNHLYKSVFICTDKKTFDFEDAKKRLNIQLKQDQGYKTLEYHYSYIEPCIFAEEYLNDGEHESPYDYKFYCCSGKPVNILLCVDRGSELKLDDYDLEWNIKDYSYEDVKSGEIAEKPKNLEKMIKIAEELSKEHVFVRVDLYEVNGKIYFGELTFTPGNGVISHYRQEALDYLGSQINLPI